MTLKEQIKQDIKQALKEKDKTKADTLRGLLTAIVNEAISQGKKPNENIDEKDELKVLKRLIKQRKEAITQYEQNNREDLANQEKQELQILEKYLPEMPNEEEIKKIIQEKIDELSSQQKSVNTGMIIGMVMKHFDGNVDGGLVKKLVDEITNS